MNDIHENTGQEREVSYWRTTPWPFLRYNILAINRGTLAMILVGSVVYCAINGIEGDSVSALQALAGSAVTFYFMEKDSD